MNTSMIAASVTMGQLQRKLDTISHNIANSNTTGFKRREATFSDLLFQQVNNMSATQYEGGRLTPDGIRVGAGAKIAQTALRLEQGPMIATERELDFAITEKNHFFRIQTVENGNQVERLTRDGTFYLSEDPNNPQQLTIVTKNGDFVLNENGNRINVPLNFKSISLSGDGQLLVTLNDGTIQNGGQFALARVLKPQLLDAVGENLYRFPDFAALGLVPGDVFENVGMAGRVSQGFIEGSNVDLGREMNELIMTQRHYQFNSRAISMSDEMSGLINGLRR
ncbi:flagellar hook-basal body protein [Halalkalibacter akibai]|uniref:Flagellar basal-body rod protein FlgG n=1 Tax=Halalkalibacter akibai (strain ATCC 43226 / DSM 21942 / CIP 109018 / JCM 9157 / 1139) TaxID=1236973 RepID=W4QP25_HALA3|nr:flagellar hook-basal body protein [Halalkalibacter akibai]GAE33657.1 flagellar basal-body rod protein FlgG [Halalkalibacter akibai JCM 9157]